MGPLKDIRISWPAFALLAVISGAATLFILAGGNARSAAQSAALAALKNPPKVLVQKAASPSGAGTQGGDSLGQGSGGSNQGGSGGATGTTDTGTTPTQTTAQTTSTSTSPATTQKHHGHHHHAAAPDAGLPHVSHVFEIALSTSGYQTTFGKRSQMTYLHSLVSKGALLSNYESFGNSSELTDYIAMLSGQGPTLDTDNGCPVYTSFPTSATANAAGVVSGNGCIYPDTALTIADQTGIAGQTWGAYIQSMGAKTSCQYPEPGVKQSKGIIGTDPGYSLNHNPFVYFESLLEEGACDASDLDLSFLHKALAKVKRTPNFTYIAPNACADSDPVIAPQSGGSGTTTGTTTSPGTTTAPAVGCPAGDPNGVVAEDAFLKQVVPEILKSPAYRKDGVLVITFAASGDTAEGQMVRTGTLVLSAHTKHGITVSGTYSPYSLLRSVEDMLDYQPLANAASAQSFAKKVL